MEPENLHQQEPQVAQPQSSWHQVTPLSKYLAMALFIILPFVGGYVGYTFAPEKIVEVEKVVIQEVESKLVLQKDNFGTRYLDMDEYSIGLTPNKITVFDNQTNQSVQTIEWTVDRFTNYSSDLRDFVDVQDINYDNYWDLGVLQTIGQGSDLYYGFYTFDPEQRLLVRDTTLGDSFESEGVTIANPNFNIKNKTVSSCVMGPVALKEYRCQKFIFDGETYVKGEQWTESWDEDGASLDQLLSSPDSVVEICVVQDELTCFGSGRKAAPELETNKYLVYELVSNDEVVRYGLIDKESGVLSELFISLEN